MSKKSIDAVQAILDRIDLDRYRELDTLGLAGWSNLFLMRHIYFNYISSGVEIDKTKYAAAILLNPINQTAFEDRPILGGGTDITQYKTLPS